MYAIAAIILVIVLAAGVVASSKKTYWKKAQKMYGYFEFMYNGERGSSRDYGPMLEIDMIGAMNYRQQCGAVITFEEYNADEEKIMDLIDSREYLCNLNKARRTK